jgi:hypothetical protein
MAGTAHSPGQEFWQPPAMAVASAPAGSRVQACEGCGTEFIIGSRFCHVCGTQRRSLARMQGLYRYFEFAYLNKAVGVGTLALIALLAGIACVTAAALTGLVFGANTTLDWQAIQLWRIQWLLAAAASFLAGILLKKSC